MSSLATSSYLTYGLVATFHIYNSVLLYVPEYSIQPDKFHEDPGVSDQRNAQRREQHNDRFVKVSIAYDVLSDEKKRNAYDKYGQNGLDMLEKVRSLFRC